MHGTNYSLIFAEVSISTWWEFLIPLHCGTSETLQLQRKRRRVLELYKSGNCAMNRVGGGKAFSSQAFWVLRWAYSSSVFWVRGELCLMKEWAILHVRGQGHWPSVRRAWHWNYNFRRGDGFAHISVCIHRLPWLSVSHDKDLWGHRESRGAVVMTYDISNILSYLGA